jgi:hypothetical protein
MIVDQNCKDILTECCLCRGRVLTFWEFLPKLYVNKPTVYHVPDKALDSEFFVGFLYV